MKPDAYDKQAQDVADKIGIEIITTYQGGQCPEWFASTPPSNRPRAQNACPDCGSVHGEKYRVTIKRKNKTDSDKSLPRMSISFDYWASWADCHATVADIRRTPTRSTPSSAR